MWSISRSRPRSNNIFPMQNSIPETGITYERYRAEGDRRLCIYKRVGFTPLQALNEVRGYLSAEDSARCTYAGRLDPMAEGWMHLLWSGDMQEKDRLTSVGKTYEIEILLGVSTDTGDMLGLVDHANVSPSAVFDLSVVSEKALRLVGPFVHPYPAYSSPRMKATLEGVVQQVRMQQGRIDRIEIISHSVMTGEELYTEVMTKLSLCRMDGDFRLDSIADGWKAFRTKHSADRYMKVSIRVDCASGTYMRTLAEVLGESLGVPALAFGITRVGFL